MEYAPVSLVQQTTETESDFFACKYCGSSATYKTISGEGTE